MTYFTLSLSPVAFQRDPDPCPSCDDWRNSHADGTAYFRQCRIDPERRNADGTKRFEKAWECGECKEVWYRFRRYEDRVRR